MPKSPKFDFTAFVTKLQDSANQVGAREVGTLKERIYFLIVTEGEKTEPIYFESFKRKLPRGLLDTIQLIGEGANTITVVTKAISERQKRKNDPTQPDFEEVWAVFDRDDFGPDKVNQALQLAAAENVSVGFSNQAFELWYILHFQFLDADLHRHHYIPILTGICGFKYEKNNEEVVAFIAANGNVTQAILRARTLCERFDHVYRYENAPLTTVYQLVEKLLAYCEET
ncbi:MAG: RloB family protein [Lewinella sp.]